MDKHCDSCGRSIIEPIDFEEASRRAFSLQAEPALRDEELISVSANEYGLWSARFLHFSGTAAFTHAKALNIEQE